MHFRTNPNLEGGLGAFASATRHQQLLTEVLGSLKKPASTQSLASPKSPLPVAKSATSPSRRQVVEATSPPQRIPLREGAAPKHGSIPPQAQAGSFSNRAAKRVSYTTIDIGDVASQASHSDDSEAEAESPMEVADILCQLSQSHTKKRKPEKAPQPTTQEGHGFTTTPLTGHVPEPSSVSALAREDVAFLPLKKRRLLPSTALEIDPTLQAVAAARATQATLSRAAAAAAVASYLEAPAIHLLDAPALQLRRAFALAQTNALVPPTAAAFHHHQHQQAVHLKAFRESQEKLLALSSSVVPPPLQIPGQSVHDVLFGRSLVSHSNTGNRRLLVQIVAHSQAFFDKKDDPEAQQKVVQSVFDAVKRSGGRLLYLMETKTAFQEYSTEDAMIRIRALFSRVKFVQSRVGTNLNKLFGESIALIWNDTIEPKGANKSPTPPSPPQEASRPAPREVPQLVPPPSTESKVSSRTMKRIEPMTPLAPGFQPGPFDVICSRGSAAKNHAGNKFFVQLIERNCQRYTQTTCKLAKSMIVSEMLDTVRRSSPEGGFVKQDADGTWCETGDHLAREKIGQCFRDRLHTMYASSSKSKLEKRRLKSLASGQPKKDGRRKKAQNNEGLDAATIVPKNVDKDSESHGPARVPLQN